MSRGHVWWLVWQLAAALVGVWVGVQLFDLVTR
jgi:hypothetical protein